MTVSELVASKVDRFAYGARRRGKKGSTGSCSFVDSFGEMLLFEFHPGFGRVFLTRTIALVACFFQNLPGGESEQIGRSTLG